jgi:hypothetical protein
MANNDQTLRPYGPGKYSTILDSVIHALTMDGCDDETGDVQECGTWYGLLRGLSPKDISATARLDNQLTASEMRFVFAHQVGCIVSENDQGFVSVEYFNDREELETRWKAIEEEIAQCYADAEEEEEEIEETEEEETTEPGEDDLTTTDHETFYQYGKRVLEREQVDTDPAEWHYSNGRSWESLGAFPDCESALRAYMERVQFWPDAWFISDHGNAHRIDLTEAK